MPPARSARHQRDAGSRTAFTADDLAGDVASTMDAAGFERAHVIGHSLGASVAVILAARRPDRLRQACRLLAQRGAGRIPQRGFRAVVGSRRLEACRSCRAFGAGPQRVRPRCVRERNCAGDRRRMDRHPIARATIKRYIECDRGLDLNPVMRNVDASTLVIVGQKTHSLASSRRVQWPPLCPARGSRSSKAPAMARTWRPR